MKRPPESAETGCPLPSIDHELADRRLYSVGLGKSTKCFLCMDEKLAEGSIFLDATRGPLEHVPNTVVACESGNK